MTTSYDFTHDRAQKSRDTQNQISAAWLWSEKTIAAWDADITALEHQNDIVAAANADMLAKRGIADTALDQLDLWTGEGLTLMRVKLRNDPEQLATIDTLTADGTSRANKLQEALDWENAWNKIDPTFAPSTANTFAAFHALRLNAIQYLKDYKDAEVKLSAENSKLTVLRGAQDDINQAWYKAATKHFKPGTAEGDTIRSQVPTTSSPPPPPKPAPPAPPAPPHP